MAAIFRTTEAVGVGTYPGLTRIDRAGRDLSFSDVLRTRLEKETGLKFSAHAMDRLNSRGITLQPEEISRLSGAIERASQKGATDSLILLGDKAFIVSIENRTVVTALDGDSLKDTVFTKIDSAVVG